MPRKRSKASTPADIDDLIAGFDVQLVRLSECLVDEGWRLDLGGADVPGIHYCLAGTGRLIPEDWRPIDLEPHTLVVLPPRMPFQLHAPGHRDEPPKILDGRSQPWPPGAVCRYKAGPRQPHLILICGHFRPTYGAAVDLFSTLASPIVEHFGAKDRLDDKLKGALEELVAQEVGSGAMATALLKQVLVVLIRRSIASMELWAQRFSPLADPQVAKALAAMVAKPGAPHNVERLASHAALSRSAFMTRFTALLGKPPMVVLRDLRIRQAAILLASGKFSVERVAHDVGYASKSSFLRAFKDAHGCYPADYRARRSTCTPSLSPRGAAWTPRHHNGTTRSGQHRIHVLRETGRRAAVHAEECRSPPRALRALRNGPRRRGRRL